MVLHVWVPESGEKFPSSVGNILSGGLVISALFRNKQFSNIFESDHHEYLPARLLQYTNLDLLFHIILSITTRTAKFSRYFGFRLILHTHPIYLTRSHQPGKNGQCSDTLRVGLSEIESSRGRDIPDLSILTPRSTLRSVK